VNSRGNKNGVKQKKHPYDSYKTYEKDGFDKFEPLD
jgi:hypothetical protein